MGVKSSQEILDVNKIVQTPRSLEKLVEKDGELDQVKLDLDNKN